MSRACLFLSEVRMDKVTLIQHREDIALLDAHMKRNPKGKQRKLHQRVACIKRNRVSASGNKVRAMRIAPMRDYQYAALAMCGE